MGARRYRSCPLSCVGPMEETLAYTISAGIAGFGVWILVAGLSSGVPIFSAGAAAIPVAIGLISAFGDH